MVPISGWILLGVAFIITIAWWSQIIKQRYKKGEEINLAEEIEKAERDGEAAYNEGNSFNPYLRYTDHGQMLFDSWLHGWELAQFSDNRKK